jgi:hypothetical protein
VSLVGAAALPPAASSFYASTTGISATVVGRLRELWGNVQYGNLEASWTEIAPQLLDLVSAGQLAAAGGAEAYLAACLAQLGIDGTAFGAIAASSFAGSTGDGRDLLGALYSPVVAVKRATAVGVLGDSALQAGLASLVSIASTAIEDAARSASSAGMVARPAVTGWVRAVNAGACARCVILAGRFYRWSDGFDRHPRCKCKNVPTDDKVAGDLVTDPKAYVDGLADAAREKLLGVAGAKAYADGANLNQLVNAKRGTGKAQLYGRSITYTVEGVTKRGLYGRKQQQLAALNGKQYDANRAPRIMPETIYEIAENRAEARNLLVRYGYLTDEAG